MSNQPIKKIEITHTNEHPTTWRENWEVMKPFVHFAFKAMTIITSALIGIIRLLPTLTEHNRSLKVKKDDKVIKI
jgi:hypothetical protein